MTYPNTDYEGMLTYSDLFEAAVRDAAELKRDAERYRWLRSKGLERIRWEGFTTDTCDIGLDYAVDQAMLAGDSRG